MARKAVLTGASGFIGSHVAGRLLGRGYSVKALLRKTSSTTGIPGGCDVTRVDFLDPESMAGPMEGCDTVIHCAGATSAGSREEFDRINALITANVLKARKKAAPEALFIYVSSQAAAGPSGNGPVTAYGRSKLLGEFAVRDSGNWMIIRPPAVFGPGDDASAPVMRAALKGFFFSPRIRGRGFPLVFVDDLADLVALLPERPGAMERILTPSYGRLFSWNDFHRLLQEASGRHIIHVRVPVPLVLAVALVSEAAAAISGRVPFFCREKCRELLAAEWKLEEGLTGRLTGWSPATPVRKALEKTLAYYHPSEARTRAWMRKAET